MEPGKAIEVSLRAFLADRDAPCPNCGYNLRALTAENCPECNAALELRVGLVEPRLGAFLCGAIGLGAGIGFSWLILGFFLWEKLFNRRWGGPPWRECVPLLVSAVALAAGLALWVRTRQRQRNLSPAWHWALGSMCWVATVASAVWFFAATR